jgi:hypothetical protein
MYGNIWSVYTSCWKCFPLVLMHQVFLVPWKISCICYIVVATAAWINCQSLFCVLNFLSKLYSSDSCRGRSQQVWNWAITEAKIWVHFALSISLGCENLKTAMLQIKWTGSLSCMNHIVCLVANGASCSTGVLKLWGAPPWGGGQQKVNFGVRKNKKTIYLLSCNKYLLWKDCDTFNFSECLLSVWQFYLNFRQSQPYELVL